SRPSRLVDNTPAGKKNRPCRRSPPLRQAGRDRVESRAKVLHLRLLVDRGVEDARAVQMDRTALLFRQLDRRLQIASLQDPAGDGVLEREQPGPREVRVVGL